MIPDQHTSQLLLDLLKFGNCRQYYNVHHTGSEEDGKISSKRTQMSQFTYRGITKQLGKGYLGEREKGVGVEKVWVLPGRYC
jgi:hypothetical protein